MTEVVVVTDDDSPGNDEVTTDEVNEIVEEAIEEANEESAERDTALIDMIGQALAPLSDRITALEFAMTPPAPDPVEEAREEAAEEAAEEAVEEAVEDAAEAETEAEAEIIAEGTNADGDSVPDADAEPEEKKAKPRRDRSPKPRRGFLTTMLGGSGGIRRGNKS